jgi:hypothetical protein
VDYDENIKNVINMDIGALQPGKTAEIEIKIFTKCEVYKHGFYTFTFPLQFLPIQMFYERIKKDHQKKEKIKTF